jgi:ubiquitin
MINIKDKKCECGRCRPSFGYTEDKIPTCRDFINANYEDFQHDKPLYTPDCDVL